MPDFTAGQIVLMIAVGLFTVTAAYFDTVKWKIPNWLTVSFFGLGLVYQPVFNGWWGLLDGLAAFALGFGLFFLIWMIGSGGGGDVKLMGALSIWLGWKMLLAVLVTMLPLIIFLTMLLALIRKLRKGVAREYTDADFEKDSKADKSKPKKKMTREEKIKKQQERRLMAFALPVAISTWFVVYLSFWEILPERFR